MPRRRCRPYRAHPGCGGAHHTRAACPAVNLTAAPSGSAAGLVLENHASLGQDLADAIGFRPILRLAGRVPGRDECLDLSIAQAAGRGASAEPLFGRHLEDSQHAAQRAQLAGQ